ncbi:hypothetical protein Tco_0252478 [Tanacetum coccineum]
MDPVQVKTLKIKLEYSIKTRRTRKTSSAWKRFGRLYFCIVHDRNILSKSRGSPDSEVSNDSICSKSCLKTIESLKSQNDQLLKDLKKSELMVLGEITIRELRKKLDTVQKEKDDIQLNVDKFEHASKSLNKLIECQIVDNCKKGLGYDYTGNFMPPTPDLSFTSLDEFVNKHVVENCKAMSSEEEPKVVRKNDVALIIEE